MNNIIQDKLIKKITITSPSEVIVIEVPCSSLKIGDVISSKHEPGILSMVYLNPYIDESNVYTIGVNKIGEFDMKELNKTNAI